MSDTKVLDKTFHFILKQRVEFPNWRVADDVFQRRLQKANEPGLLLQYEDVFG
jgi:hypothetical protein